MRDPRRGRVKTERRLSEIVPVVKVIKMNTIPHQTTLVSGSPHTCVGPVSLWLRVLRKKTSGKVIF